MRNEAQTRANGEKTRAKILDAAEELFGRRGFESVSLRDITQRAEVTLALATYHFGTKEKLFESVVARRADILCQLRRARLAAIPAPVTLRAVMDAFIAPLFEQAGGGDPGWADYVRVLARLSEDDRWLDILATHFDTVVQEFLVVLSDLYPDMPPQRLARGFLMVVTMMLSTVARHRRLDRLTGGAASASDLEAAQSVLLDIAVGGLTMLAQGTGTRD